MDSKYVAYRRRKKDALEQFKQRIEQLEAQIIELESKLRYEQERTHFDAKKAPTRKQEARKNNKGVAEPRGTFGRTWKDKEGEQGNEGDD